MSEENRAYDPYETPTPYETLGLKTGIHATAKEIGKSFNKATRKARHIKDSRERAARIQQLEWAKEQLQRPENRVMVDFFLLSDDLFVDLCVTYGQRLAAARLPTQEAIGPLMSKNKYDDLVPKSLDQFLGEFRLLKDLEWFDDDDAKSPRMSVCATEF